MRFMEDTEVHPQRDNIRERAITAAEGALEQQHFVGPIDVLVRMRLLEMVHVEEWKKGRIDFLESTIQANPKKISKALSVFEEWALEKGLVPKETQALRTARGGNVALQFTQNGDPEAERFFRTQYFSPNLPERKQQKLEQKLSRPADPVVFDIVRESECSECGAELDKGDFLMMDAGQPLCLPCAGFGDLEYLEAGDPALTRRATKYTSRKAVVVRFSRSRGRYERQGILVEPSAIERAEQECSEDAEERARARAAGAVRRKKEDQQLVARMTEEIQALFPRCPSNEAEAIAAHTAVRGSGRVGRSAAGRKLEERPLVAAVRAAIRHQHTDYDALLAAGIEREDARARVLSRVQDILERWSDAK